MDHLCELGIANISEDQDIFIKIIRAFVINYDKIQKLSDIYINKEKLRITWLADNLENFDNMKSELIAAKFHTIKNLILMINVFL